MWKITIYMMSAEDIAKGLNCSKSHAYKIVKELNKELAGQGYIQWQDVFWIGYNKQDIFFKVI